jgi:hypothetical protein
MVLQYKHKLSTSLDECKSTMISKSRKVSCCVSVLIYGLMILFFDDGLARKTVLGFSTTGSSTTTIKRNVIRKTNPIFSSLKDHQLSDVHNEEKHSIKIVNPNIRDDKFKKSLQIIDTVELGTLTIPKVGVGTISWSGDTGTCCVC